MAKTIQREIEQKRIIAILRGIPGDRIMSVTEALYNGGIRLLEITFNQKSPTRLTDTGKAIEAVKRRYGDSMKVGAGTVMSLEEVHAAYDAGAEFMLAPNVNRSVIEESVRLGMEAVPGALTPSEIADSYQYGASVVKLFPAGNMGLDYCKAVMAPINHIPMIAVGGVDDKNLSQYIKTGFIGAGIGSNLTDKTLIEQERYEELQKLAALYVTAAQEV